MMLSWFCLGPSLSIPLKHHMKKMLGRQSFTFRTKHFRDQLLVSWGALFEKDANLMVVFLAD